MLATAAPTDRDGLLRMVEILADDVRHAVAAEPRAAKRKRACYDREVRRR